MGEIMGDVAVNPARVQIVRAAEPGGASRNQQVRLTSRNNKPFKVEKVEDQPSGPKLFDIALSEDKSVTPSAWNLTMTGQAPQTGAFRGELAITTDLPDEKVVKVQYFGFVRNQPPAQPGFVGDAWTANPSLLQR